MPGITTTRARFARLGGLGLAWGLTFGLTLALGACRQAEPPPPPAAPPPPPPPVVEEQGPVWPDEPFRAQRPAPGPVPELRLPGSERFTLESGLQVVLVKQEQLPTIYMTLQFDLGDVDDPRDRSGMHSLCVDLLDEGTKRLEKVAFEEAQADHAINLWASAGRESTTLGLRSLKGQLGPALDLFAEMIREPGLRQRDLDRLRSRRKAAIVQARGTPASISRRVYPALVWGERHPYGQIDTEESLDKIQLRDCQKIAGRLRPDGAQLFVVGQIDEAELRVAFGERLRGWKGPAPKAAKIPEPAPKTGAIYFIDAPGAAQSVISIGHPGPKRDASDYEATYLMAQILGGSFSSRINMNLREDKGFAYGGRGDFSYARAGSVFTAGAQVRTDATAASLREVAKEIAAMRAAPPTEDELRREQSGAIAALPARFATPTRTLNSLKTLVFYGLSLDWYQGYSERVAAVDPAGIHSAAQKHLRYRDVVVLVVGDAEVIEGELEALAKDRLFGEGGLVRLDADGRPLPAGG